MSLWGVESLDLDIHSDHNKGTEHAPCACPNTHPIDHSHITMQTTNLLIARPCQEVLTVHGNEWHLFFGPKHSLYSHYKCHAFHISAVGTTFNVFSYDAVWA